MRATLNTDITARMLAMDALEGEEGYPADHIIGPRGSTVQVLGTDGDFWVEVDDFANDPFAIGFVRRADLDFPPGTRLQECSNCGGTGLARTER